MSNETCENINLKQIIMDEGLYEEGMSLDDMEQIYKTLNRSKRSADDDNEYRDLLSQTDLNCTNIELLKTEKQVCDVEKINQTSETELSINEETVTNNNEISKTKTFNKDFIFNFNTSSNYKPIIPIKRNKNLIPLLYHHPKFQKLNTEKKTEIIKLYLRYQQKRIIGRAINPVDQWGKPIVLKPRIEITQEHENVESSDKTIEKQQASIDEIFIMTRSKRLVKRKNYDEGGSEDEFKSSKKTKSNFNSQPESNNLEPINESPPIIQKIHSQKEDSDDNFGSPILTKKTKLNDHLSPVVGNQSTPLSKAEETAPKPKRWYSKLNVAKYEKAISAPVVSDRTNKLFNKLKEEETNKPKPKEFSLKSDDTADLSDNNEEIFPIKTIANVHSEVTPKLKKGKGTKKKPSAKTRKKLNLKSASEEKIESIATEITATNFYGKNKENELDASNNNESSTSKMTQCPICSQSFPDSEIEAHASRCEQFEDAQDLCVICDKYFPSSEMDAHKFKCLEKITESSVEKSCEKNKTKSKIGFLCNLCDKYVVDSSEFEHASNCIATSTDS